MKLSARKHFKEAHFGSVFISFDRISLLTHTLDLDKCILVNSRKTRMAELLLGQGKVHAFRQADEVGIGQQCITVL